jgi:serine/threonine-protein kinase
MSSRADVEPEWEERLAEALGAYEEAADAGRPPELAAFLEQYPPDLAAELRQAIADRDLAAPLKRALADQPEDVPATHAGFPQFRDYVVEAWVGSGGFSVIYKARHKSIKRLVVALKVLRPGLASPEELERLLRAEADAYACLDHPHIVPIYGVSAREERPYFTMKFFERGSLAQDLAAKSVRDPRADARLLALIARAVHHAHQRGILHRDLKPGNILLDEQGQPHVTDFGLAMRVKNLLEQAGAAENTQSPRAPTGSLGDTADYLAPEGGATLSEDSAKGSAARSTLSGQGTANVTNSAACAGAGTIPYMAPEQAAGEKYLTTAVDVYGLGAILYQLLTGRPPFEADQQIADLHRCREDLLRRVREGQPPRPRRLRPRVNRDL